PDLGSGRPPGLGFGPPPEAHRGQLPRGEHAMHALHEPVLVEVESDRAARRIAALDESEVDDEPREAVQHPDREARSERAELAQAAIEMRHPLAAHDRLARGVEL